MIERNLTNRIVESLADTPVVYLQGARQTGKSTLAQLIAEDYHPAQYLSLDSVAVLSAAESDPEGFVAGLSGNVVLDEVQRAPSLAVAIKSAVDADRRPGRFLLTGSASALALPRLSETLVGRVELHTLWPFSAGEMIGRRETFIDRVFAPAFEPRQASKPAEGDVIQRLLVGGYPEAVARKSADRRYAWFESYITTILTRDVRDLANIERIAEIPRLLALLASRLAELVNHANLSRSLSIPVSTLKRYFALLEATFLVRLLPAWSANIGKRLTKSPKLLISDTGLVAYLLDLNPQRLQDDRPRLGHLLENFVAMELIKQMGWAKTRVKPFHFRTESGQEVDLVLEDAGGRIVGIEVKATVSLDARDLRGLKALAELCHDQFICGIVFYLGDAVVPFGKNLWAVPVAMAWS
jgi:predicted AAA+ superfamily ATPase